MSPSYDPSDKPAFEQGLEENTATPRLRANLSKQYRVTGEQPDSGSPGLSSRIVSGADGYTYVKDSHGLEAHAPESLATSG